MIWIDTFGLVLAAVLAFSVWGPDMLKWIGTQLGARIG